MDFPVSGVSCSPFLPPAVAFLISLATSSAGLSGAFLLLPFQMSVLGFVSPAVSPTNLIYNIVASPGGVYRYAREGRMAWALTAVVVAGTLPGVFLGALIRVHYLPDPRHMKLFVGFVLLYLAWRLLANRRNGKAVECGASRVHTVGLSWTEAAYEFGGAVYRFSPLVMFALSLAVGVIGGIYGIGGGAIISPFMVAILGLPVFTVAGAAMFGTFITSVAGVFSFHLLGVQPDWALGALFGAGGLAGTYAGARLQKHLPERWIRVLLGVLCAALALNYIVRH